MTPQPDFVFALAVIWLLFAAIRRYSPLFAAIVAAIHRYSPLFVVLLPKNTNFCEFCEKRRTLLEKGCLFCEFCENDARFPWVEFVDFPKNSLTFSEKRTFSEKGRHFCEFCENDARFPWVEFVDSPENSLNFTKNVHVQKKCVIFVNSAKMTHVSHG